VAPDVVIFSPHLDDAVLSIGGLIGRLVDRGREVEVWTCYTDGPPLDAIPPARRVFGDYTTRRAEDARALAVLGAGRRWLDLPERIWREPPLAKLTHIFHTPADETGFARLRAVREAIAEALAAGALVYAPLGVGHHHDHVEVALAALQELRMRGAPDRIRFYEDAYALGGGCRRRHFVTRRRMFSRIRAPGWASPRIAALLRIVDASAKGPGIDDYLPAAAAMPWRCAPEPLDAEEEQRKLAAIAEYGSQVKAFGGIHHVRPFVMRGHAALGGEPIWRLDDRELHVIRGGKRDPS
jgi:LmbE family N-acetylglucosaminyl deacetylase